MTVPRIQTSFVNSFLVLVTNDSQCSEFPFSFGWEPVARQEDTIFDTYPTSVVTSVSISALTTSLQNRRVNVEVFNLTIRPLARLIDRKVKIVGIEQICINIKMLSLVLRSQILVNDTFSHENVFINTVSSPFTVLRSLSPRYVYNRIVFVCRVAQIQLDKWLVVCQTASPTCSIGQSLCVKEPIV